MKKGALRPGEPYVSAQDLCEECLCVGWIDSKPAKVDERRTALLCTPRKPGSGWSKVNKDRLERLLADGLVLPAGLAAIDAAKADGSWSKLDHVDALAVPDDLAVGPRRVPGRPSQLRRVPTVDASRTSEWILQVKTAPTRARRIDETARLAADNIRVRVAARTMSETSRIRGFRSSRNSVVRHVGERCGTLRSASWLYVSTNPTNTSRTRPRVELQREHVLQLLRPRPALGGGSAWATAPTRATPR